MELGTGLETEPSWFAVAEAVGDDLVPGRADWVLLHVRTPVLDVVRAGLPGTLEDAGIGAPVAGEPLSIVALRHRDSDLEVALRQLVLTLAPRVGDPYGSGRVTLTGRSRLASNIDPAHLRAIATGPDNLRALQQLNLGSAVIAPVVAGTTVIGALNLVWSDRSVATDAHLADAEHMGREVGAALDGSRAATARLHPTAVSASRRAVWRPPGTGNPVADARSWTRRLLPEVVNRPAREDVGDDLDLVLSELVGNALRHAGGVREVVLEFREDAVRLTVVDGDDRTPVVREPGADLENGRGLLLVGALSRDWGVEHDLTHGGKGVWSELEL